MREIECVLDDLDKCKNRDEIIDVVDAWDSDWLESGSRSWPGASFAHIVVDDYNLEDANIEYCEELAKEWFVEAVEGLKSETGGNYLSPYSWERFLYDALVKMTSETLAVLLCLKSIPEERRDG